ncbi:MAG: glycosyltransferase family 2 protein [Bacteroidales bacterium]|jgi:GT2 family glycosyltransferase|nr:glycosyltransferase family 2 protein [Bacteroidales bacterium]
MSETAVVILNWNGKNFLQQFLPNIINYTTIQDTRIIIADNHSTDDSIAFLNQHFPTLELIRLDKNYGFAGGYNQALHQVKAKYYVLLNSDIEVTEGWLKPLIELMDSDEKIAACQPKIKAFDHKQTFEYAGASGGFIDKYGYPFCRGRILDTLEKDNGQYNDVREIFWATGACMVVRANLFHQVGGFDDDFFAHMEEIDLCWRLKNSGYKIVVQPASEVFHVGGGTLPASPFKLYLNYRNNLFLLYKNLPKGKLLRTLFPRMIFDGLSAMIYLLKFSFRNFTAVGKAHIHFYQSLRKLRAKRKIIQPTSSVKDHREIFQESIVINYFFRKKKKFSQLKKLDG